MSFCHSLLARGPEPRRLRKSIAAVLGWSTCAVLAGCSGINEFSAPIATYGSATVFSPSGYNQSKIDDTHYQVTATGTEATPKARVEKIARARAAQIGVDEKMTYYKVTSVQHGLKCEKSQPGYKSETTPASSRPTVTLAVEYAKEPADPGFVSSSDSFASLSSEIASEVVSPEQKAAAAQETRSGCGQG